MNKIKIIINNDKDEINKYLFKLKKFELLQKVKLNKIFIYSNLLIIDFILIKKIEKKSNIEKLYFDKDILFDLSKTSESINYDLILKKYKRASIVYPLPNEIIFKPIMSKIEIIIFSYFMKKENIYFEFGSGGSTNIASYYKLKTYSVERDFNWHEKLKKSGVIANYITINLNAKNNTFGYPGNDTNKEDWKKYIQAYKKEYNADIIFIDGRFRVACALDIFPKIRNDTLVFIHDYKPRIEYHILEDYYIKIKTWDSLALFLKRPDVYSIQDNIYNFYLKEKAI